MSGKPNIRCAIYTRKSSDEGLDQEFNSLDAQHEACAAYISSQRHEGWRLVNDRYDDGGLSGGTLERAALQRLMTEIEAGRIRMVVVYKIDRLTRSLADFVRLVERLDAAGCSFVSVTQAFNTSSSMGRLTLNVLLSFAQFEREVTAERIRDKISASKKKGLWMGGTLPLGYDRHPDKDRRELVVNPTEAETVRALFQLYADAPNLKTLEIAAHQRGLRPRQGRLASGRAHTPPTFSRGQLHYMLTNPVYRGRIRHKEKVYPGKHPPIIDDVLWQDVQTALMTASGRPRSRSASSPGSGAATSDEDLVRADQSSTPLPANLLTGLLRDETGDRLTPTHTVRSGRRYRYYVSNRLISGGADPSGWRIPAAPLERRVVGSVADHLRRAADKYQLGVAVDAADLMPLAARANAFADKILSSPTLIADLIVDGKVTREGLSLTLDRTVLATQLAVAEIALDPDLHRVATSHIMRRRGSEIKIVTSSMVGDSDTGPDATLINALAEAHHWSVQLRSGTQLADLTRTTGLAQSHIRRRSRLAFLSPDIQAAILAGKQPCDLTLERLVRAGVALDWDEQRQNLGFSS
ncbi:recombinase family protein [Roseisalinus antarcticus]|uniref:DNA-invertase hin n=1 Tax=Roseisalinus antarcticus TaxID=254357 RepID=A0A1Y5TXV4_9RHOB|nr:recombinase family protein [Roseisalinus antarcticus]SLN76479.1 DNA-invertase hin [Roseisalinus antarcticus]